MTRGVVASSPLFRLGERRRAGPRPFAIGGVLPLGEAMLLIGAPKSGKSAVAVAGAHATATGGLFFGHRVRQGLVVYVPVERYDETERRLEVAFEDSDDSLIRLARPKLYAERKAADDLAASILDEARAIDASPTLVIFDTAAAILREGAGDENSQRDVGKLTVAIDRVRELTGAAVILVHHAKRGEKRSRGSEALEAWADVIALADGKADLRRLTVIRSNTVEEGVKATFKLTPFDLGEDEETGARSSVVLAEPVEKQKSQTPTPIRLAPDVETAFVALQQLGNPADVEAWRKAAYVAFGDRKGGTLRNAFHSSRAKLLEHGLIFMVDDHTVSVRTPSA